MDSSQVPKDTLYQKIYASVLIERGKTDVTLSRLKQIAEVLEIGLSELLGGNEKNVLNVVGTGNTNTHFGQWYVNSGSMESIELKHELEKARLIMERQEQENAYLKKIISLMEEEKGPLSRN